MASEDLDRAVDDISDGVAGRGTTITRIWWCGGGAFQAVAVDGRNPLSPKQMLGRTVNM
jgi:hypothetical protein